MFTMITNTRIASESIGASVTFSTPGQVGDALIMMVFHRTALTATPSGATLVKSQGCVNGGQNQYCTVYWKIMEAGDVDTNKTFTQAISDRMGWEYIVFRPARAGTPYIRDSTSDFSDNVTSLNHPMAPIGILVDETVVAFQTRFLAPSGYTVPSGYTAIGGAVATARRLHGGYKLATASATEAGNFTVSTSASNSWASVSLALSLS